MISRRKKDPSPEFLSFACAQLEILPSPARGEGIATPGVEPTLPEIFDFGEGFYYRYWTSIFKIIIGSRVF